MSLTERNEGEKHFEWWLNELLDNGYILGYTREDERFPLFPDYVAKRHKVYKTKMPVVEDYNFLQRRFYNYDYKIRWTRKSLNIFFQEGSFKDLDNPPIFQFRNVYFIAAWSTEERVWVSYVDVKPPPNAALGKNNNSFATFPLKRQILLWLHGIWINKAIPVPSKSAGKTISLFPNTFTPRRYLITEGGTRARKINFHTKTIEEYSSKMRKQIEERESLLKKIISIDKPKQTKLL